MKKIPVVILAILVLGFGIFTAYTLGLKNQKNPKTSDISPIPTKQVVGGDRDEHGCIPSAGYSWCEVKQKCLRSWEEACDTDISPQADGTESLKKEIKVALVAKYGSDAEKLNITVSKISGDYAQGGASQIGAGGGMWFAVNVAGIWKLVWDGNGIITCDTLRGYPDFPSVMIPECFDEAGQKMISR